MIALFYKNDHKKNAASTLQKKTNLVCTVKQFTKKTNLVFLSNICPRFTIRTSGLHTRKGVNENN